MSRRILMALSALVLTGLASTAASAQASQASGAANGTTTSKVVAVSPVAFPLYNSCNAEPVDLKGVQHVMSTVVAQPDGSTRVDFHVTFSNMKGIGETTGAKYELSAPQKEMDVETLDSGTSDFMIHLNLVGQGSTPNMDVQMVQTWSWSPTSFNFSIKSASTTCH